MAVKRTRWAALSVLFVTLSSIYVEKLHRIDFALHKIPTKAAKMHKSISTEPNTMDKTRYLWLLIHKSLIFAYSVKI